MKETLGLKLKQTSPLPVLVSTGPNPPVRILMFMASNIVNLAPVQQGDIHAIGM